MSNATTYPSAPTSGAMCCTTLPVPQATSRARSTVCEAAYSSGTRVQAQRSQDQDTPRKLRLVADSVVDSLALLLPGVLTTTGGVTCHDCRLGSRAFHLPAFFCAALTLVSAALAMIYVMLPALRAARVA